MKRLSLHSPILYLSATIENQIALAFHLLNNGCVDEQ
jgi:hypothetical protein